MTAFGKSFGVKDKLAKLNKFAENDAMTMIAAALRWIAWSVLLARGGAWCERDYAELLDDVGAAGRAQPDPAAWFRDVVDGRALRSGLSTDDGASIVEAAAVAEG